MFFICIFGIKALKEIHLVTKIVMIYTMNEAENKLTQHIVPPLGGGGGFLIEVTDKATTKEFIKVGVIINKGNPNYIRPLDNEINAVFDTAKNKNYKYGETKRWILKDDNNKLIGRIAAYVNTKYVNKGTDYPVGGAAFFECIDDQQAANILFDAAKAWLQSKGMEAMDGPINFGDR